MLAKRRHRRYLVLAFAFIMALHAPIGATLAVEPDDDPGSPVQLSHAALASELFEAVFNSHDADAAATLISAEAVIHTPYRDYTGPRGLLAYLAVVRSSYLHPVFDVTTVTEAGDSLVIEWTLTATGYRVDPAEAPIEAVVTMPGETTLAIGDGTVTAMTEHHGEVVARSPEEIAITSGHVQWP